MNIQVPFGFVTGCHAGDKFMVQATLSSMRHYCPQVPICLVVDGDVDVSDLERSYDLTVLRILDLPLEKMRNLIGRNTRAKLAAMWEGPFEHLVWVDSDAIILGDITNQIRTDLDFQIFWSEESIPSDANEVPSWLSHFYFNLPVLLQFDPGFEWRGHPYFSAGVFACRKNFVTFEEWCVVEDWNRSVPGGFFKFWDQGILNYLVHSRRHNGRSKVARTDLQFVWRHVGKGELEADCRGAGWRFPPMIQRPKIAHFCGRKPFIYDRGAYSRPFTIARLEHHRRTKSGSGAWLAVISEELGIIRDKFKRRIKRQFRL
jgi:hypothetical protein